MSERHYEPLHKEEILSIQEDSKILIPHTTFKVEELIKAAINIIKNSDNVARQNWNEEKAKWALEGVKGEVLKFGAKGWQKGKLRLTIEFCPTEAEPTEPESPLDEIRQKIREENP
ncbi:KGK domain-containing protein [Phormidium sp. CCY1219]|uniref:KGK domain-containing protein n=1 Tax=Phormidium sp. CCY1219 TaxID=2886104 RepID=UPI002D1E786E|nr:KGK domain-containing protein [Phormidium sp. CCY1219]MEB3828834.1 hypothetical protein [Phormidium sp. CCY1219]